MPKFPVTHVIEPRDVGAMLHPDDPNLGQLSFLVAGGDVHYVVLSRRDMQRLAREIEKVLKATPSPSDDR